MSVENCIDQLSASQYISVIPRIVKAGKFAEEVKGQPPLNSIRYLDNGMMMTYTTTAPGAPDPVITRLNLSALGLSQDMSKKKSLHYVLHDCPAPGWRKEILVRSDITVKSVGQTSVRYVVPNSTKILRSKVDVVSYLAQNKQASRSVLEELDFRSAFCVCHTPEDNSEYLECACGLGGCNHWFHARCVGMSPEDVSEFNKATLVCPLCTLYLETTGNPGFLLNKWVLRAAPCSPASFVENVFKLPTAEGSLLQRRDSNIYVNGLVFKPGVSWRPQAPAVGKSVNAKGRKRKAKSTTSGISNTKGKHIPQPNNNNEESPHIMLNEDDFLQLEAFLSPCDDPIESIAGSIINSNDDDELDNNIQGELAALPTTAVSDGGNAGQESLLDQADDKNVGGDADSSYVTSHGDVEDSSFDAAEGDDDDGY